MHPRPWMCRLVLAAFVLTLPGVNAFAGNNFEVKTVAPIRPAGLPAANTLTVEPPSAQTPQLQSALTRAALGQLAFPETRTGDTTVIQAAPETRTDDMTAIAPATLQNLGVVLAVPSLQNQDASATSLSGEAGASFDSVKLSASDSETNLRAPPSIGSDGSKDDQLFGLITKAREPGEMLGPMDATALGKKIGMSQDESWQALGRLAEYGHLAMFSNGGSLRVAFPQVDRDDPASVEGRAQALKAVALINSPQAVDHLRAIALLQSAYLKLPKDEDEPDAAEIRRQIIYLRLNAALEVVREAIDAQIAQPDASSSQKSYLEDARRYFNGAYYDARHAPVKPDQLVPEIASDALAHFDWQPYLANPDIKSLKSALEIVKAVAKKPAPDAPVTPSASTALVRVGTNGSDSANGYPKKAPILALTGVLFPDRSTGLRLTVSEESHRQVLEKAAEEGFMIASTFVEGTSKHHRAATLIRVKGIEADGEKTTITYDVLDTAFLDKIEYEDGVAIAQISYPIVPRGDAKKLEELAKTAKSLLAYFGPKQAEIRQPMIDRIQRQDRAEALANILPDTLPFSNSVKQALLSSKTLEERLEHSVIALMGMVRKQWGSDSAAAPTDDAGNARFPESIEELNARMEAIGMPQKVRKVTLKEWGRLEKMNPKDSETDKVRNYMDWLLELPWSKRATENIDLAAARMLMDEDHTGLDEPKDRFIEWLAIRKRTGSKKGAIILMDGPKGTGKTSLTLRLAQALGLPLVRLSLGGIKDVTDLKGHNRTYLGSQPGALIKQMRETGVVNPVFLLDEIDKMDDSQVNAGAKASLLETLDPKQNDTFRDSYLEVPYDLSQVIWVVTSNTLGTIPGPLLDRMELIELRGYTALEKVSIAKNHVIKEQSLKNGLTPGQVKLTDAAIRKIVEGYTREAGLRKLYEEFDKLFRKIVVAEMLNGEPIPAVVDEKDVAKYLGIEKYRLDDTFSNGVGVMTGLVVNGQVGGGTLNIEVVATPGKGNVQITGNLQQVITESTKVALTFVKSRAKSLGISDDWFDKNDLHIHYPDGATPKDGPSAGLAIAAAIASRATGRAIKPGIAMTGEVDLLGNAMPIGGLMQKTMGAHRSGMHTVIFPEANKKDTAKIPAEVLKDVKLIPVKSADEVLELLLEPAPPAKSGFVW